MKKKLYIMMHLIAPSIMFISVLIYSMIIKNMKIIQSIIDASGITFLFFVVISILNSIGWEKLNKIE
ncbi:MAG: hypothetical protein ACTHVE_02805 [Senegalia sp. (in: firmicutes)]|uniref:hypothetical protein n=1 Tax=Senegalia sp. (in: firmicutes) TaxID=1924098 RepID=UPI003F991E9C